MSKFKVGDRVKVVHDGQRWTELGRVFTVTETRSGWVMGHGPGVDGCEDGGVWDRNLSLVEEETDTVNHPSHYKSATGLEVIDVIEAFDLDRYLANVVKCVLRSPNKGNEVEDLKKAVWYLQRKIDRLETNNE